MKNIKIILLFLCTLASFTSQACEKLIVLKKTLNKKEDRSYFLLDEFIFCLINRNHKLDGQEIYKLDSSFRKKNKIKETIKINRIMLLADSKQMPNLLINSIVYDDNNKKHVWKFYKKYKVITGTELTEI